MEERTTYSELKEWFCMDAFRWCQRKFRDGKINKWNDNESEWGGGALYSFENSFDTPIENLMLQVVYVILRAGRNPYGHRVTLKEIDKILLENNLDELISVLDEEEKKEFLYDLNLVLNNREIED